MLMEDFKRRVGLHFTPEDLVSYLDIDIWHFLEWLEDTEILLEKYDDLLEEMGMEEEEDAQRE